MYVYIYVYVYVYICIYIYIYMPDLRRSRQARVDGQWADIHICVYVCIYNMRLYVCIYIYICIYVHTYIHTYMCVYIYTEREREIHCVCIHVYIYIYIYIERERDIHYRFCGLGLRSPRGSLEQTSFYHRHDDSALKGSTDPISLLLSHVGLLFVINCVSKISKQTRDLNSTNLNLEELQQRHPVPWLVCFPDLEYKSEVDYVIYASARATHDARCFGVGKEHELESRKEIM